MRIELELEDASKSVADEFAIARLLHRKRRAIVNGCRVRDLIKRERYGLCLRCPSKATHGQHCKECAASNAARMRARRAAQGARSRA